MNKSVELIISVIKYSFQINEPFFFVKKKMTLKTKTRFLLENVDTNDIYFFTKKKIVRPKIISYCSVMIILLDMFITLFREKLIALKVKGNMMRS